MKLKTIEKINETKISFSKAINDTDTFPARWIQMKKTI